MSAVAEEPIRVLLVEDDPDDATLIRMALGRSIGRFDVRSADRLDEALAAMREAPVDVVLLDLGLPDSAGLETFTRFHGEWPDTPVIVLNGAGGEPLAMQAVREGATDFLIKDSLDADTLSRAVRYVVERHRMQREIRDLATVDELTGLLNRRGFLPMAEHHLKLAHRTEQPPTLLFIELDGLEAVNDAFGRAEGSELLVDTAGVLRQAVRDSDVPARIGEDEFCVLLTGSSSGAAAMVLTRLVEAIATHNARSGRPYALSLSVGAATYDPEHPCPLDELVERAHAHMDEQRRRKRDRL